jgi:hypothetical protein
MQLFVAKLNAKEGDVNKIKNKKSLLKLIIEGVRSLYKKKEGVRHL